MTRQALAEAVLTCACGEHGNCEFCADAAVWLRQDISEAEIERRYQAALKAVRAERRFALDGEARRPTLEMPVRLGVSLL